MRRKLKAWTSILPFLLVANPEAFQIKVMTYNIKYLGISASGVVQLTLNNDPDIIGYQEGPVSGQNPYKHPLLAAYDFYVFGVPSKTASNIPIFFKRDVFEIDKADFGKFQLSDTPEKLATAYSGSLSYRAVEWVRLIHKRTGHGVYVFNTHLHWSGDIAYPGGTAGYEKRQYDNAVLIGKYVDGRKDKQATVLFTCDCNRTENQPPMQYLYGKDPASPVDFVDTYKAVYPGFTGRKIDFVLIQTPRKYRVTQAKIVTDQINGVTPSDHDPVTATLEIEEPVGGLSEKDFRRGNFPRPKIMVSLIPETLTLPEGFTGWDVYTPQGRKVWEYRKPGK